MRLAAIKIPQRAALSPQLRPWPLSSLPQDEKYTFPHNAECCVSCACSAPPFLFAQRVCTGRKPHSAPRPDGPRHARRCLRAPLPVSPALPCERVAACCPSAQRLRWGRRAVKSEKRKTLYSKVESISPIKAVSYTVWGCGVCARWLCGGSRVGSD